MDLQGFLLTYFPSWNNIPLYGPAAPVNGVLIKDTLSQLQPLLLSFTLIISLGSEFFHISLLCVYLSPLSVMCRVSFYSPTELYGSHKRVFDIWAERESGSCEERLGKKKIPQVFCSLLSGGEEKTGWLKLSDVTVNCCVPARDSVRGNNTNTCSGRMEAGASLHLRTAALEQHVFRDML